MVDSVVAATPPCPRCKRTDCTPLVKEEGRQRFQCRCSEIFWADALPEPAPSQTSLPFVPISIPPASDEPPGRCPKCLKPYWKVGKKYEKHLASCDGKHPYTAPKKRVQRSFGIPPTPAQVYEASLAALMARKSALETEIRGLDLAIAETTEKLKAAGGPPPAPFRDGGRLTP